MSRKTIGETIKELAETMRGQGKLGSYILEQALLQLHETPEGSVRIHNPNDKHIWKDDVLLLSQTPGYAKLNQQDLEVIARLDEALKGRS